MPIEVFGILIVIGLLVFALVSVLGIIEKLGK